MTVKNREGKMYQIIDGKKISQEIKDELKEKEKAR